MRKAVPSSEIMKAGITTVIGIASPRAGRA